MLEHELAFSEIPRSRAECTSALKTWRRFSTAESGGHFGSTISVSPPPLSPGMGGLHSDSFSCTDNAIDIASLPTHGLRLRFIRTVFIYGDGCRSLDAIPVRI